MAVVSSIIVWSSRTKAGTLEFGAMALYSGVLCSSLARSKLTISILLMPFSSRKTSTFFGLGASLLE